VQVWHGDFATLWRAPPGYREGELAGNGGPLGHWLALHLAGLDGPGASARLDDVASVCARVLAFQLTQGLAPDGLAGPLTLKQLNRASGIDEPRLAPPR
jgi:general secretion pathway protein A